MTEKSDEKARQFIEQMRDDIIKDELPIIGGHLADLERKLQNGSARLQVEAATQEVILLDMIRATYRLLSIIYQLMNTDMLSELLKQHYEIDGSKDELVE
jgi:hypothetical protein